MRTIQDIRANDDWTIDVLFDDGQARRFDLKPWLADEAFEELRDLNLFKQVRNGGYFIEWANGADLSADTLIHLSTPNPVPPGPGNATA